MIPVGNLFSAFDQSLVVKEQRAAVRRPGSNWRFSVLLKVQLMGRAGIELATLWLRDDLSAP